MSDKKRLINFAEEYDRIITEAARRSGLSFSAFCRSAALEKAATIVEHVLDVLQNESGERCLAVIEQVAAMRGQGVSSMFRFGEGYGMLQMGCAANKLPVQFVTPAKWKGYFGLSRDKGVSRGLAMQRFPDNASDFGRAKDDGRAEAALLCLYAAENMVS